MSTRYRMALGVSPLLLRLALAITFIWAGLAKVAATMEVDGSTAAILANMGVVKPSTGPAGTGSGPAGTSGTPGSSENGGTGGPTTPLPPPTEVIEKSDPADGSVDAGWERPGYALIRVGQPVEDATGTASNGSSAAAGARAGATGKYSAAEFPEKVRVKTMYVLAASLWMAAHPAAREDGTIPRPIWPPALAEGRLPIIFAYLVVAAELGGGVLLLLGLLTRFAAFSLAGVMAGAMWLSQIGPAIQSGSTRFGFLPAYPEFDGQAWTSLMWQMALLAMSLALMFSGPGYMAADHALFGGRRRRADHDGE